MGGQEVVLKSESLLALFISVVQHKYFLILNGPRKAPYQAADVMMNILTMFIIRLLLALGSLLFRPFIASGCSNKYATTVMSGENKYVL